ncbi:actin-bundling T4SS effector WalE1 family protein [Wolbachia endosymbiont of Bemisia tabaci]|uniref:actin-bundling T4SS effector WalE1 family protein n=1 Tax=Wolbachia endosymbiont of Bemisia tabaci TaxID=215173 RepID=UPI000D56271A|nr:hypothetical protein [Wolbachia endosymbiont of Bemisia tabaci]
MSPSEKHPSNFVETKQDSSLSADIVHDSKKLKERITDLLKGDTEFSKMKKGDQALVVGTASGLFAAVLPLLAVGATLAIPSAIVGLTLFFAAKVAIKAVQSGYKGLKWSAEKTVEGAKHIGGKIKDGYEYSADSLKRGASFVSEGAANKLHKAAGKEDYSDKLKRFTPKQVGKSDEIRKDLKEIFADKGNNSELTKDILSRISSRIDSKIKEKTESGQIDQTFERLLEQGKFISGLSKESLHSLLTQRSLPKDTYLIDSTFSEHHDEIKEVIKECKEEHTRFNTLERLNKLAKRHKASSMNSLENSLSGSSSMNSLSSYSTTSSEAELLNPSEHKEVKAPTSFFGRMFSSKGGKKPEEVTCTGYKRISEDEVTFAEIGNSRFYVAPEKPPRSNSMGSISTDSTATTSSFASYRRNSDSGFNSPSSSPQHGILTKENGELKTQADLRKTGSLDKLVGPSSAVTVDTDVEHQAPKLKI